MYRKRKRRYRQDLFALDAEDVPAGGKNAQPGRRGEQLARQYRTGIYQVLAVVQEQQQPLVLEVIGQPRGWLSRGIAQVERTRDCLGQ